ncbi:unnamed protein product [Medioppia subpectinata]|uniref:Centromere/kinetochore protein zw10-like protein n=1 Tax=Medioppia subpectinata TaxID=1979941 RepID=A0A7R9PVM2_9ACAR|nr:unnamed protein product [Medioppia subpectinata]CAG2102796.1 unnamed protein product [Medioppia subpectinata]
MMQIMSEKFDFDDYVLRLLLAKESPDYLRKRIQTDIESTRKRLAEELQSFDIDLNELNTNYNKLIAYKKEMTGLESELNAFLDSDLVTEVNDLRHVCRQHNDRQMRSKSVSDFTDQLKQIYDEMQSIDHSFSINSYDMAFKHMDNVSLLYKQLIPAIESNDDLKPLSKELTTFLHSIRSDLVVKREELIYNTKTMFNSNVKAFKDEFNSEYSSEYKNFIKAFVEIRENEGILRELIKSLNQFFIITILNEDVNQIVLEDNKIIAVHSKSVTTSSTPLSLLKLFFDYTSQIITDKNGIPEGRQLLRLLGQFWTEDIFDQILKYYLNRLMPKNESEIKSYLSLVDSAEDIRHFLIELCFIDDNTNSPFIEFALNINSHFCRRLCTDFLIESKMIICRDLHQTVNVGSDENPTENSLPSCRVSEFIVQLKQLMEKISELCSQCSTDCSHALIQTMADICELFIDISPVFHNKMITQFPQQNAIFHNNCMFFANFIESFALKHKSHNVFNEFVALLRELGSHVFLQQMRSQEKTILELIQSQQFSHCINDMVNEDSNTTFGDQLSKEFRHILKQCLVHFNFLRQTLVDVLPQRANLLEIVNRWADGYGILAAEFTAQDVKQLIRVLFQNTERRAQALNRIISH